VSRDRQVSAIGARLRAEVGRAAAELQLEVTANLIEACPVDTGHARANFVPSIGAAFAGEDDGAAQEAGTAGALGYRLGDGPLHITNNVPYIGRLIGGHSQQAPPGWDLEAVDRAVATIQARYDGLRIDVTTGATGPSVAITPRDPPAAPGLKP
jgi:hypothetical protein